MDLDGERVDLEGALELEGKVALVTGGASGIGEAAARLLAASGARVAVVDRDEVGARRVADEVGGSAHATDVSAPTAMAEAVAAAEERFGRLDVVLLNAGMTSGQNGVTDLDVEGYRRIVGVNVDHVVFGVAAAVPALRRAGGGVVVATASLAGLMPHPGDPLYTLTKHAVVGYVRAAAPALADEGIRLAAVCPGYTDTALIANARAEFGDFPLLGAEDVAAAIMAVVGNGGPGECWFVQPGREPGPYGFRGVPGPAGGRRAPEVTWEQH
ncbi:short-chain dehydrogenase/reductase SDR [Pseudonocardia dioxanivorans CB1190]|uniref:Short-chain dehydrogenase/reductase SDR n=1 Tax=Pseudonocardia dioxanivorans (strain ATCC 55486 / DSM 44775 / JCM 13855 / CB1190) TaxID=675635 RepID=F4CQ38_PSEUX|nr:SDR family NAD(P)-dependent oxidoreductase [Pseudonocardia dioxanivorans]AEA27234.1 short-chain dehydrogenase/reductase SDR [Pseudonocardia dioxanivorans CB1190]